MPEERLFDLNIEKILEAWEDAHAVRELISNALDEQILSGTSDVEIFKREDGAWIIRDYGRGLRYEHFTQNENEEKLKNVGRVIGKFGVGLKDALATLHRNGVGVDIQSAHGSISLREIAKHDFDDVVTLHAVVRPSINHTLRGTRIVLHNLPDVEMARAKAFFLRFSDEEALESTRIGDVLRKKDGRPARVYVAGLLVAEEENFAFSYNITSLTEAMRKALNRERTNVGRTAYTERVKQMLLQTKAGAVADVLKEQLLALQEGFGSDEVGWKDVAVHAVRILNAGGGFVFVTAQQLISNASAIDHARNDGLTIITIAENIQQEVVGMADISGGPIRDLGRYEEEWNASFTFDFVDADALSDDEHNVLSQRDAIAALAGGLPGHVSGVMVSNTMRVDFASGCDAVGLWDPETKSIVIRRDQLSSIQSFAGALLHEIIHAKTGYADVTREFELALTQLIGTAAAQAISSNRERTTSLMSSFFGRP
jgi:hypothetical protein